MTDTTAARSAETTKDLETLAAWENKKRWAWAGLFNGARTSFPMFEGREEHLMFGKAECEWVPASFWTEELPALGWITILDGEKRPALGMEDLPEGRKPWCWDRSIEVTSRGWAVRDADLEDYRRRMDEIGAGAAA